MAQGFYPLDRCKTVHLVRHGEGFHNVAGNAAKTPAEIDSVYRSAEYFDAGLTPTGWDQVDERRVEIKKNGIYDRTELVVVSPLLRTLQTAVGIFGGEGDLGASPPLMETKVGDNSRGVIPSLGRPPFIAHEDCREKMEVHPCDKRKNKVEYQALFPAIDFTLIADGEDELWNADVEETVEEVELRGLRFLKWLFTKEEKDIAVVAHGSFFYCLLKLFQSGCDASVSHKFSKYFGNCEIRSFVLVDKFTNNVDVIIPNKGVDEQVTGHVSYMNLRAISFFKG